MLPLNNATLAKLAGNLTKANDADVRLNIAATPPSMFMTSDDIMIPETVYSGDGAGGAAVAFYQPDTMYEPTYIYLAAVRGGMAELYRRPYRAKPLDEWAFLGDYGPADYVSIVFDGVYENTPNGTRLKTNSNPTLFKALDGNLTVQTGLAGATTSLASGVVGPISAVRGWKNSDIITADQGIIVCYVDGAIAKYRNYCTQQGGNVLWESERTISGVPSTAKSVSVFQTYDYRVVFVADCDSATYVAISERAWSLMSIPPSYFNTQITGLDLHVHDVTHVAINSNETFAASITGIDIHVHEILAVDGHSNETFAASITGIDIHMHEIAQVGGYENDTMAISITGLAFTVNDANQVGP